MGKNEDFPGFEFFFPIFSAGPISAPISGAIFFLFRAGSLKPIFYQVGGFSNLPQRKEGLCQGAPKERRRVRAEKRLSKRVVLESPFLLCPLKVFS